jgi:hypothetical protein
VLHSVAKKRGTESLIPVEKNTSYLCVHEVKIVVNTYFILLNLMFYNLLRVEFVNSFVNYLLFNLFVANICTLNTSGFVNPFAPTLVCRYINSSPLLKYIHFETDSVLLCSTWNHAVETNKFFSVCDASVCLNADSCFAVDKKITGA